MARYAEKRARAEYIISCCVGSTDKTYSKMMKIAQRLIETNKTLQNSKQV